MCEYGDFHSSADHSNLWVSQNLHRDFTAAYLGLDQLDLAERYWAASSCWRTRPRRGPGSACLVDTYGFSHLHYYPRGITSLGLYQALGGARLSKLDGRLVVAPVRVPCRTPLLTSRTGRHGACCPGSTRGWRRRRGQRRRSRDDDLLDGLEIQGP